MKAAESVHIVDDDQSVQMALSRVLEAAGYSVRRYKSAGDFLISLAEPLNGCLLLDMRMPGPNGLRLQEALTKQGIALPIIFMSAFGDIPTTVKAMKGGAFDFLTKPVRRDDLLASVRLALAFGREKHASNEELKRFRACFASLSPRERDVFKGVVSGKLNKQIAADLGTAERTVKAHRAHLMEKMNASSLADLVHMSELIRYNSPAPQNAPAMAAP